MSITKEELADFIGDLKLDIINQLKPEDFAGFGLKNSKEYFKLFRQATADLSKEARTMVVCLAVAVRSKKRILMAIDKFKNEVWYAATKEWFLKKSVQYTEEEVDGLFAVVHIPSCQPFLAASCFVHILPPAERTVMRLLQNTWAAQLKLEDRLLFQVLTWEVEFWSVTIRKGGGKFKGPNFSYEFWATKAKDNYELLAKDGTPWVCAGEAYTLAEVAAWLKHHGSTDPKESEVKVITGAVDGKAYQVIAGAQAEADKEIAAKKAQAPQVPAIALP